jgi:hypothetical protein
MAIVSADPMRTASRIRSMSGMLAWRQFRLYRPRRIYRARRARGRRPQEAEDDRGPDELVVAQAEGDVGGDDHPGEVEHDEVASPDAPHDAGDGHRAHGCGRAAGGIRRARRSGSTHGLPN